MNNLVERFMLFDVAGTVSRHITEEDDLLRLKPIQHLVISVHKQNTCSRTFLGSNRGYGNASADRLAIKAPLEAVMIAPADGRDHCYSHYKLERQSKF